MRRRPPLSELHHAVARWCLRPRASRQRQSTSPAGRLARRQPVGLPRVCTTLTSLTPSTRLAAATASTWSAFAMTTAGEPEPASKCSPRISWPATESTSSKKMSDDETPLALNCGHHHREDHQHQRRRHPEAARMPTDSSSEPGPEPVIVRLVVVLAVGIELRLGRPVRRPPEQNQDSG